MLDSRKMGSGGEEPGNPRSWFAWQRSHINNLGPLHFRHPQREKES